LSYRPGRSLCRCERSFSGARCRSSPRFLSLWTWPWARPLSYRPGRSLCRCERSFSGARCRSSPVSCIW
jgi:hypothetical protein